MIGNSEIEFLLNMILAKFRSYLEELSLPKWCGDDSKYFAPC